jgi:hypothetical protein
MVGRREPDSPAEHPVSIQGLLLLQVDLEGHSDWLRRVPSQPTAVECRIALAERLTKTALDYSFLRVYWAGDGGMYSRHTRDIANSDIVVDLAKSIYQEFYKWRQSTPRADGLGLRVSAHRAHTVHVTEDPSYWTSDDLNVFAKYERLIGISGTIAVTDALRKQLSEIHQRLPRGFEARSPNRLRSRCTDTVHILHRGK